MVATSAGARLTLASLVVTSTFPLVVARVPCTVLPSARTTWTGLSALTDSTWSQDVVTTPKWSVLMVRFLPSFLMMLPVTRSPFFITTWSAHAALTAGQTSKDKDRILILLSIIVGHALLSGIGSFRRVARGRGGRGGRPALQFVGGFHNQENHQRHNEEIDHRVEKLSIRHHRSRGSLGCGHGRVGLAVQANEQLLEVHVAEDHPDRRHDDVIHHRGHDRSEGRADDHSHGEVENVALHYERFKFLQHVCLLVPVSVVASRVLGGALLLPGND